MSVAPNVKLPGGAADVNRDRLKRELRLGCCFGRLSLPGLGRFGGIFCGRGRAELGGRLCLGALELSPSLRCRKSSFPPLLLSARLGSLRFCVGEHPIGERKLGVG